MCPLRFASRPLEWGAGDQCSQGQSDNIDVRIIASRRSAALHRFQSATKSRIPHSCQCAMSPFLYRLRVMSMSQGLRLPFPGDLLPHDGEQGIDAAAIGLDP